ncbi:SUKH-3 domain-containing protein [Streptomyces sp. NPDC001922]|uniref:SUKH-3 domain-containing protein n=1 Tax=Streptomyces sp. NPDC001922 TaxID=3364624 RepID=UPI003684B207
MRNGSRPRWSAKTNGLLEEAGWYPGRSVSTAEWERGLRERDGFEIHPMAQRFLAEFGGLNVTRLYVSTFLEERAEVILDPALAKGNRESFEVLSADVGAELYPLGMTANRKAYLGMTPAGAVYAGMTDACFLGESGDQALDELVGQIA